MSIPLSIVGVRSPELLATLHTPCFAESWDRAAMAETLAVPGTFALVACLGSGDAAQPVGLAIVRIIVDEAELLTIGVVPEARGRYVGAGLMNALLDETARRGGAALFLEVAEDNHPARRLYSGLGAELIGRRRNYYRWPDGSRSDALMLRLPVVASTRKHTNLPNRS